MNQATPDLAAYFRRIGYEGEASPTLGTLRALHRLHPQAIPFENLSPFLGHEVPLDVAALQAKMVEGGRGGYCFEHNLLFREVLLALGFQVTGLAARVRWDVPAEVITPRTHMLLRVDAEGESWIVDVGFGRITLTAPLRLQFDAVQPTPHEPFRIVPDHGSLALQVQLPALPAPEGENLRPAARQPGAWKTLYVFDLQPQFPTDYGVSNWYLSHHPQSLFVTGLMAARPDADRRHTLSDGRYSVHGVDGTREIRQLQSPAEIRRVLEEAFHIRVPQDAALDTRLAALLAAR